MNIMIDSKIENNRQYFALTWLILAVMITYSHIATRHYESYEIYTQLHNQSVWFMYVASYVVCVCGSRSGDGLVITQLITITQ